MELRSRYARDGCQRKKGVSFLVAGTRIFMLGAKRGDLIPSTSPRQYLIFCGDCQVPMPATFPNSQDRNRSCKKCGGTRKVKTGRRSDINIGHRGLMRQRRVAGF